MKKLFATALLLLFTLVPALSAQKKETEKKRDPGLYATLSTSLGDIVIKLYEKESPVTVKNFVLLANGKQAWRNPTTGEQMEGVPYFEGIIFHRVIPRFMIQTGDPTGTGRGGPGYTIPDEFDNNLKFNKAGVLGMANSGPNTGGSQFFITLGPTPHLTGKHTIFGQVIEGQDIVVKIGKVRRNRSDKPFEDVVIQKVLVQRVPE